MENSACNKSSNGKQQSSEASRAKVIIARLARFYSVMGNPPAEDGALSLMAEIIAQCADDGQLSAALTRCARECQFPVRLPDILRRIPGYEIADPEAEARAAFDQALTFAKRYVFSGPEGNTVQVDHCRKCPDSRHLADYHLPQRLQDTVRRVGGWRQIALYRYEQNPFIKKEFLAEYQAWRSVERHRDRLPENASRRLAQGFTHLLEGKAIQ